MRANLSLYTNNILLRGKQKESCNNDDLQFFGDMLTHMKSLKTKPVEWILDQQSRSVKSHYI